MATLFRRLMEVLAGASESDLRAQIQYLKAENQILRSRLGKVVVPTPRERARLVRLGRPLGSALKTLVSIVHPATFCRWLLEASTEPRTVKRRKPGRPRTPDEVHEIVLRIARETGWGYTRILGELKKLRIRVCRGTVINILKEANLPTGPQRGESTWGDFVTAHAETLWACDFLQRRILTVTGWKDAFVLVFINVATRRGYASKSTFRPSSQWAADQITLFQEATADGTGDRRLMTRDQDEKFGKAFDEALEQHGITPVKLPHCAPNLNAHVERFIQTIQVECLDKFIVLGSEHLDHLVSEYLTHYNTERPHSGISFRPPTGPPAPLRLINGSEGTGPVRCATRLGGVLRHYSLTAHCG